MVTKSLVEVPFSVHGLIFIESVRGPFALLNGVNHKKPTLEGVFVVASAKSDTLNGSVLTLHSF